MPFNKTEVKRLVSAALIEDAAQKDITTLSFIPQKVYAEARIIAKERGVVAGIPIAQEVFKVFDPSVSFGELKKDGAVVNRGQAIAVIKGKARSILSCERVALNFLSYLSGIASGTHEAVSKVRSKGIRILDTRKTTPLFRGLEKYAVATGSGVNHRFDLAGQYLVKDNHLFILRKIKGMDILADRKRNIPFEIEVDHLSELPAVLSLCPDIVMLDNFSPAQVKRAVKIIAKIFPNKNYRPLVELSGGITPKNISRYAIRGVDFISLGSLTHSAKALDISLEITKVYSR
ncbi:MAG: carboxylating nicotinate-nucleotide diphosphorylase [Candidatus Omnitrophota bacterium]